MKFSNNPLISVIIPTYNGSMFLNKTIDSVFQQDISDYEVILIDDGSTQDLQSLLRPYTNRIFYVYKKNSGPAATRNIGIQLARGKYIAFLDHDDLWLSTNLRVKVKLLEANPDLGMVYSYHRIIDAADTIVPHIPPESFPEGRVFLHFLRRNRVVSFSSVIVRRELFQRIGYLDERPEVTTCDDYDLWLRIADIYSVGFSKEVTVLYRMHDRNLVSNLDQNLTAHLFVINKTLHNCLTIHQIPTEVLKYILKLHIYDLFYSFAYRYFYSTNDYFKANILFRKLIFLKPTILSNYYLYFLSLLSKSNIAWLRKLKHKLFHTTFNGKPSGGQLNP